MSGWEVLGAAVGFTVGMVSGLCAVYLWAIDGMYTQALVGAGPAALCMAAGQWLAGSYGLRRKYGRWKP